MRAILQGLEAAYPDAQTALQHETPFQLLVATILSAQCTDARVNAVTPTLFRDHPDAASFAEMDPSELEPYIRACGLFRAKSRNILSASRRLMEQHGGEVPATRAQLLTLPGVGRKTANVVLANAFGRAAIAVDTHVFRVSRRLGLAHGETPREVEEELMAVLPREAWAPTHHRFILHGRRLCKAPRPLCAECPLTRWCDFYREKVA
ncbi:endonuclease III [soil metagenome]